MNAGENSTARSHAAAFNRRPAPAQNAPRRKVRGLVATRFFAAGLVAASLLGLAGRAQAQSGGIRLIRDAEIEQLMRDYANPLLNVARVNTGATKIYLIGDRRFNAFVAEGRNIFINVGAIMESEKPNELIGVLAHEIGHIAGGHLVRQRMALDRAAVMAVAGMLMSAGALVASSRSRQVGADSMGTMGVMLGPQEIVRRSLLAYQRGEEQAADIAAVKYLSASGQSARGLLATMERFNKDTLFKTQGIDPYLLSHPLPAERISFLQDAARKSASYGATDPAARVLRHEMARAKLYGFLGDTAETGRRYPLRDTSMPARYARAIAAYRFGRTADAINQIDALIKAQPKNPYFHELKGQALLEAGRAGQAVAPLKRAVALAPQAVPIRVMLGHALVSTNNPQYADEAIRILTRVTLSERENGDAYQYLAMAYGAKGNQGMAMVSAAQALFIGGRYVEARTQASRAQKLLPKGSPGWLQAQDILDYRPPKL